MPSEKILPLIVILSPLLNFALESGLITLSKGGCAQGFGLNISQQ
jgi:hypothetical protein